MTSPPQQAFGQSDHRALLVSSGGGKFKNLWPQLAHHISLRPWFLSKTNIWCPLQPIRNSWRHFLLPPPPTKILFLDRGEGRKKEEGNISVCLPLTCPLLGIWPATQACALTGNQTGDPVVCRRVLNPLSRTSQGQRQLCSSQLGRPGLLALCGQRTKMLFNTLQLTGWSSNS